MLRRLAPLNQQPGRALALAATFTLPEHVSPPGKYRTPDVTSYGNHKQVRGSAYSDPQFQRYGSLVNTGIVPQRVSSFDKQLARA